MEIVGAPRQGSRLLRPLLILACVQVGCSLSHLVWMRAGDPAWLLGDTYHHLELAMDMQAELAAGNTGLGTLLLCPGGYPHLVHLLTGGLQALIGVSYWAPWLVMQGFSFLLGVASFGLARGSGVPAGLLAGSLTLLSPGLLMEGKRFELDIPGAALANLGLVGWLASDGFRRRIPAVMGSLAFGLAVLAKYQALLLFAPALPALWWTTRARPLAGRLAALVCLALPACFGVWLLVRSLPHLAWALQVTTDGRRDLPLLLVQFTAMSWHTLLGPVLSLVLLQAGLHDLRRGRWAPWIFVAVLVVAHCSFSTVKARHVLGLLPVLAALSARALYERLPGSRWQLSSLALLALCSAPWWPPDRVYTVSVRDLEIMVPSDREFGLPDPGRFRLGFSPADRRAGAWDLIQDPRRMGQRWYFPPENSPGWPYPWSLDYRPMRVMEDPGFLQEIRERLPDLEPPNRALPGVNMRARPLRPTG